MTRDTYVRRGRIVRLIDGDTCVLDFDMGMSITVRATVRLFGINTPEVRGPEKEAGHAATQHLADLLVKYRHAGEWDIVVQTFKDKRGKFGRYLATLIGIDAAGEAVDLNQRMVADGHAVVASY